MAGNSVEVLGRYYNTSAFSHFAIACIVTVTNQGRTVAM